MHNWSITVAIGDLLGNTKDWMSVITSMTSAVTTPNPMLTSDAPEVTSAQSSGSKDDIEGGPISYRQVFELLLPRLSSEWVGQLLTRGCGLGEDYDSLSALLVETAALRTQQRFVYYLWCPLILLSSSAIVGGALVWRLA